MEFALALVCGGESLSSCRGPGQGEGFLDRRRAITYHLRGAGPRVDVLDGPMKRQSGYGGFPTILLTFSLLLLVLAVGFVVGRVVVTRLYVDMAPKFERTDALKPSAPQPVAAAAKPGRVYVPPPVPPEEAPEGVVGEEPPLEEGAGVAVQPAQERPPQGPAPPSAPVQPRPQPAGQAGQGQPEPGGRPLVPVQPTPQPSTPPVRGTAAPAETEKATGYSVQVGVFASRQGARRMVDELARGGYPARIEVRRRGTQTLYRVLTGDYKSEYPARQAADQLRREGFDAFLVER